MSEANRTFGRESGNIANPSKSENCQGNFRDLQKDLVVLRVLMLLLTSPSAYLFRFAQRQVCYANVASPPLLKGEALSKIMLRGIYTNAKALLLGEAASLRSEVRALN